MFQKIFCQIKCHKAKTRLLTCEDPKCPEADHEGGEGPAGGEGGGGGGAEEDGDQGDRQRVQPGLVRHPAPQQPAQRVADTTSGDQQRSLGILDIDTLDSRYCVDSMIWCVECR